jgi:PAS domain S-box-containing protein
VPITPELLDSKAELKKNDSMDSPEKVLTILEKLLQTCDTVIIILDANYRIRRWNSRALEIFGFNEKAVRGKLLAELEIPGFSDTVMKAIDESIEKRWQVYLDDLLIRTRAGKAKYIGLKVVPVFLDEGIPAGILIDGKDISDIREMRRQHAESQKFRAIGELTSGIAHEINTPIQFIRNNLQYINSLDAEIRRITDKDSVDRQDLVTNIRNTIDELPEVLQQSLEGVDRITRMIKSLRNYAHPGREKPEYFSPGEAINDALTLSENQWKHASEVHTEISGDHIRISGYPSDFSQAMINLIINATHAIEERYGPDSALYGRIDISLSSDSEYVVVQVRDNGSGMSEDVKARMFEPFFTTKKMGKGTGQGLAMVYACITGKHNGKITVESAPDDGTLFTLHLPKDNTL